MQAWITSVAPRLGNPTGVAVEQVSIIPLEKKAWLASMSLGMPLSEALDRICSKRNLNWRRKTICQLNNKPVLRSASETDLTAVVGPRTRRAYSSTDVAQEDQSAVWGICLQNTTDDQLWILKRQEFHQTALYIIDKNGEKDKTRQLLLRTMNDFQAMETVRQRNRHFFSTDTNWKPDFEAKACDSCGKSFSWRFRRHHCRVCGQVFCKRCCRKVPMDVPIFQELVMRICVDCVRQSTVGF